MKTLHCYDAGFDCACILQATTEEELLTQTTLHAQEMHCVEITKDMAHRLKNFIKEEEKKVIPVVIT
jgi:predicted small metal-binding protein